MSADRHDVVTRLLRRPWVEVAERVGRFSGGFEALWNAKGAGFDSFSRFLAEAAKEGDPKAVAAFEQRIRLVRRNRLGDEIERETTDLVGAFFDARRDDHRRFQREFFPWESGSASPVVGSVAGAEWRFAALDEFLGPIFDDLGFSRGKRGKKWLAERKAGAYRLQIRFEEPRRAPWMTPSLALPELEFEPLFSDLFFFSNIQIGIGDLKLFRLAVSALANDVRIVLPATVSVIERAAAQLDGLPQ